MSSNSGNLTLSLPGNPFNNDPSKSGLGGWSDVSGVVKNLTQQHMPGFVPGTDGDDANPAIVNGFLDSLFYTKTVDEAYFKVIIICVWVIALLLLLFTLANFLLSPSRSSAKMIGFHVYLCELFYLIYVLLSMINVASDFQLKSHLCDVANHGMYVTIPMMHVALLLLSVERASSYENRETICSRVFARRCFTQMILDFLWFLSLVIIVAWTPLKQYFAGMLFENHLTSVLKPAVSEIGNQLGQSSYRCSIDGRLAAGFKILLIIVFILLIVLIVKSAIISCGIRRFIPSCCQSAEANTGKNRLRTTLSFIVILFVNMAFSFPFYFVSIFTSILAQFDSSKATYSKTLKIYFLLRLLSVVFQCLVFYLFEEKPCPLVMEVIQCGTYRSGSSDHTSQRFTVTKRTKNDGPPFAAKRKRDSRTIRAIYTKIDAAFRGRSGSDPEVPARELSEMDSAGKLRTKIPSVKSQHTDAIRNGRTVPKRSARKKVKPTAPIDSSSSEDTSEDSIASLASAPPLRSLIRKIFTRSASSRV